ncbi:phage tail protein [Cellulosilyticum sp. ST5]|uniref:phage tail protein n=1 Tax=unclassified Cellulosilyticum TaxID=2643091 RepID=UPI000F8E6BE0|nr:phage tail protein [Cellulosilyticum sp. WCF-2]QEH67257.1 phage tail protein [Cellulosilyticum sp. WCF-2]
MIGALGDIIFKVSAQDVNTFQGLTRSSSGRWAYHEIHMQKPKSEFLGPDLDTISFTMEFDIRLGRNPRYDMEKLMIMTREGEAFPLVIGGDAMGYYRWTVESTEQQYISTDNKGKILRGAIAVTLKEYIK